MISIFCKKKEKSLKHQLFFSHSINGLTHGQINFRHIFSGKHSIIKMCKTKTKKIKF